MKNAATSPAKAVRNRPWGGGETGGKGKKMLFRRNEPKIILKIKELAFYGAQNELPFECKKR
jgi:hypothetical protein